MNLNEEDKILLEQWLEDESFINWAMRKEGRDMAKWEQYFNDFPQHWELGKIGRDLIIGIPFKDIPTHESEKELALKALLDNIENPTRVEETESKIVKVRHWKVWYAAASITVLMILSGIFYMQFFYHSEILLTTEYGEVLETQLPDGSHVILNANSSLTYNSRDPRKVWLDGEAFFEVKKIPETSQNFQVLTPDLKVTVLGTSFNVNSRNDQTKVFLEEGKVNLQIDNQNEDKIIEMDPGDLITYSKKHKELKEKRNNVSALESASWKEGTLIFNDKPLPEALFEIEDIYGIQFVLQSEKIKEEFISGGVPIRNIEVTLQTLSEVYGLQIRTEGKRYFISGKKE